MTKKLEDMTVEELVDYRKGDGYWPEGAKHPTYKLIADPFFNELYRRAKLAEAPKWKLTQILIELEQAGLPEPTSFNNLRIIWDRFGIEADVSFETQWQLLKKDGEGIKTFPPVSKLELIEKLKELLK